MEEFTPIYAERNRFVKDASVEVRNGFVRKVYGILTAQLLLTAGVAIPFQFVDMQWLQQNQWILIVAVVVTITTICAMACCQDVARRFPTNYILLFVFTLFEGVMVGFLSACYTWQSVLLAAGVTVGVFLLLTLYAWNTTADFTGAGPYLFAALACFGLFGLVISIMAVCGVNVQAAMMVYDLIGVLIFTFYIVFDTQMILGAAGGHKYQFELDDYVFAALNLYLDVINLFIYILSLLGDRR